MLWLTLLFQTHPGFPMEGCHCSTMKQIPYTGKEPKGFSANDRMGLNHNCLMKTAIQMSI
jgi:hypothetical protein